MQILGKLEQKENKATADEELATPARNTSPAGGDSLGGCETEKNPVSTRAKKLN